MSQVFFSRCKPQGADIVELCKKHKRVFFGWPARRQNSEKESKDKKDLSKYLIDPSSDEWRKEDILGANREHSKNRNLVQDINEMDIAIIPRPSEGCIYAGVVQGFEFNTNPKWAEEYLDLRKNQPSAKNFDKNAKLGEGGYYFQHVPDVTQGFVVDEWVSISYAYVPRWILASALGRSTYGRIHNKHGLDKSAHDILLELIKDAKSLRKKSLPWTCDEKEVAERLLNHLTPSVFEHLCVELLQLENPKDRWLHVGGSGDDGMDGLGFNEAGDLIGRLQCKLYYGGKDKVFSDEECKTTDYFATISKRPENIETVHAHIKWWQDDITKLVIKHVQRLPIARSLRIGTPTIT